MSLTDFAMMCAIYEITVELCGVLLPAVMSHTVQYVTLFRTEEPHARHRIEATRMPIPPRQQESSKCIGMALEAVRISRRPDRHTQAQEVMPKRTSKSLTKTLS